MNIESLINKDLIEIGFSAKSKERVLGEISQLVYKSGRVTNKRCYFEGLMERERNSTTGFGESIAIPHAKSKEVVQSTISIIRLKEPVEWKAMDGQPVKLIIALAIPQQEEGEMHLKILAKLSEQLMEEDFRTALLSANSKSELYTVIKSIF
ncbi:PTS sugar transporter subunit IIA [Staphylococcus shinii]|uniref:PTS sugar transporter subunit IIA n=1 Tax=Staphylococcus shinii TaxID=2912228 RepID=UPI003F54E96D